MLNQTILVGRITSDLEINEVGETKTVMITLAVPRSFKNQDGAYDTDFIPCRAFGSIAQNVCEYCEKGDLVGIKGRIQRLGNDYTANGYPIIEVIAEKVTFLSTKVKE